MVPNNLRSSFQEKLIFLPDTLYATNLLSAPDFIPSKKELGLPANAFVYCCITRAYRIDQQIFTTWMKILQH